MPDTLESLKTARTTHLISMAVAATIIALATSPSLETRYSSASEELEQLLKVDWSLYFSHVSSNLQDLRSRVSDRYADLSPRIAADLNKHGWKVDSGFIGDPFELVHVSEGKSRSISEKLRETVKSSHLEDIHAQISLASSARIEAWGPNPLELEKEITKFLTESFQREDIEDQRPSLSRSGEARAPGPKEPSLTYSIKIQRNDYGYFRKVFSVRAEALDFDAQGFREWFVLHYPELAEAEKPNPYLPALQETWNIVRGKSAAGALEELEKLRLGNTRKVSFFSIAVEEAVVIIVGPLALFLSFAYLSMHILHLKRLADHERNREGIGAFPWIALYRDAGSRLVTLASLAALPLAAGCALIFIMGSATRQGSYQTFAVFATLSTALLGIFAWRRLGRLRELL